MDDPIDLVRRFCAAWSDNIDAHGLAAFFADDATYHNIPLEPITGRDNIETNIATFIRPGPPGIEAIEFRVMHIRRCTHRPPMRRQSSQPSLLGVTSAAWSR